MSKKTKKILLFVGCIIALLLGLFSPPTAFPKNLFVKLFNLLFGG